MFIIGRRDIKRSIDAGRWTLIGWSAPTPPSCRQLSPRHKATMGSLSSIGMA